MKTFIYGCKPWSAFDDQVLKELHEERRPLADIARSMHRTVGAIQHRKKKLGLHRILREDIGNIIRRMNKARRRDEQCMN